MIDININNSSESKPIEIIVENNSSTIELVTDSHEENQEQPIPPQRASLMNIPGIKRKER